MERKPDTDKTFDDLKHLTKGPMSEVALKYSILMRDLLIEAKKKPMTEADWGPISDLIDTENFQPMGNFREMVNWQQYLGLITPWANEQHWDFIAKGYTEGEDYAIQELTEFADYPALIDSVSIYRFNKDLKIIGLEIYIAKPESIEEAQASSWDWKKVGADLV